MMDGQNVHLHFELYQKNLEQAVLTFPPVQLTHSVTVCIESLFYEDD